MKLKRKNGIALIAALVVLIILISFAAFLTSQARAELVKANNYKYGVQAFLAAEAGINRAIYELKFNPTSGHAAAAGAAINAQDTKNETWYYSGGLDDDLKDTKTPSFLNITGENTKDGYTEFLDLKQSIKLKIIDGAALINLNSPNREGLNTLLKNLLDVLGYSGSSSIASSIVNSRPAISYDTTSGFSGGYSRVIDLVGVIGDKLDEDQLDDFFQYLSVHSFVDTKLIKPLNGTSDTEFEVIDPATEARSPINVNTADEKILEAVLRGIGGRISNSEANNLAKEISERVDGNPFETWNEFYSFIDQSTSVTSSEDRRILKMALDPNRTDVDLFPNSYTTEFCFDSGGIFNIQSRGEILQGGNRLVGARERTAVVKIYDILRISTKEDFTGSFDENGNAVLDENGNNVLAIIDDAYVNPNESFIDLNNNEPRTLKEEFGDKNKPGFQNVTWFDSAPVNPADDTGFPFPEDHDVVPGAIKLGFWDNFDEGTDPSDPLKQESYSFWTSSQAPGLLNGGLLGVDSSYFEDVGTTSYFSSDPDSDKEFWNPFDSAPVAGGGYEQYSNVTAAEHRTGLLLAGYYDPFVDAGAKNDFKRWGPEYYMSASIMEGPRWADTREQNRPGILGTDLPGRDYTDTSYVIFRFNAWDDGNFGAQDSNLFGMTTTGNFFQREGHYDQFHFPGVPAGGIRYIYDSNNNGFSDDLVPIRNTPVPYHVPWDPSDPLTDRAPISSTSGSNPELRYVNLEDAFTGPASFAFRDSYNFGIDQGTGNPRPDSPPGIDDGIPDNEPLELYAYRRSMNDFVQFYVNSGANVTSESRSLIATVASQAAVANFRNKRYRIVMNESGGSSRLTASASYPNGGSSGYTTLLGPTVINSSPPNGSHYGSIGFYGKSTHPAIDDVWIVNKQGEYTTSAFTPGSLGTNNDEILWGTFSWTGTENASAASEPTLDVSLIFSSSTTASSTYDSTAEVNTNDDGAGKAIIGSGGAVKSPDEYVRVLVKMELENVSPGGAAPDIPYFEDATITYLKETVQYYAEG